MRMWTSSGSLQRVRFPRRRQGKRKPVNAELLEAPVAQARTRAKPGSAHPPIPALEAKPGSTAEFLGNEAPAWHPVAFFLCGLVLCYLALAAATTVVGIAFTSWLPTGLADADARPVEWMAEHRTPFLDALSFVGSEISGGFVIPAIVGAVVILSAFQRRWLLAGFVLAAIVIESATYRTTVFFVDRDRPDVPQLEGLPEDASFPSGHVAASIAVYSGFALLLTSRMGSTRGKVLVWAAALAIPPIVAASRMYRGMHHPLDMLAGVFIGIAALLLALLLVRVTGVVARRHEVRAR
jgi:membrane-associated phospholipid phosphatase